MNRLNLPAWAQNPQAQKIIGDVLAEQPEFFVRSNRLPSTFGGYPGIPERRYIGKSASALRVYHRHLQDAAIRVDDAAFYRGEQSDEFAQLMAQEKPDELIERLLQLTDVRGDPLLRRVA